MEKEKLLFLGASTTAHGCYFEIAPNVYAKYAYLSNFPVPQFSSKIEFCITDKNLIRRIGEFLLDTVIVKNDRIAENTASDVIRSLAHAILDFCREMPDPLYITCPILGDSVQPVDGTYHVSRDTRIDIFNIAYDSFWYGNPTADSKISDIFRLEHPYTLRFKGRDLASPCSLCTFKDKNADFCIYEAPNYSCFFGNVLKNFGTVDKSREKAYSQELSRVLANSIGGTLEMYEFDSGEDMESVYGTGELTEEELLDEDFAETTVNGEEVTINATV